MISDVKLRVPLAMVGDEGSTPFTGSRFMVCGGIKRKSKDATNATYSSSGLEMAVFEAAPCRVEFSTTPLICWA